MSNDVAIPHAPANVEAEQALLGALLYDNAAFERLGDNLQARHFYEPFHQRLFAAIETNIRKGQLAEPILLPFARVACQLFSENRFLISRLIFRQDSKELARDLAALTEPQCRTAPAPVTA